MYIFAQGTGALLVLLADILVLFPEPVFLFVCTKNSS